MNIGRRDFISLLGDAAAWPLAARAQQRALLVVGFLSNVSPAITAIGLSNLRQGLSEAGYVERRNVAIEIRGSDNQNDLLPELAADLVQRRVSVIVTTGVPATAAIKAAPRRFRSFSPWERTQRHSILSRVSTGRARILLA